MSPISKDLGEKMDKTITCEMLQADPDLYKGAFVILGGSIAEITGMVEGALIEVNQAPLDYRGKSLRIMIPVAGFWCIRRCKLILRSSLYG
jgi:outer membrane lipoprotein Slp family protein